MRPKVQIPGGPKPPSVAPPQGLMQSMPKQPGVIPPKVAGSALPARPVAVAALADDQYDWSGGWQNGGNGWDSGGWDDWNTGQGKGGGGKGKDGKGRRGKGKGKGDDLEVVVKGFPSTTDEASLRAYFACCGEITRISIPRAKDGLPKGAAFVGFQTQEGVNAACSFDKSLFMGVSLTVRPASEKHEGGGKRKSNDDLTIVIKGFPDHADEASLTAFFSSCGDIARVNLPRNKQDGRLKGAGFIEFKTQEGFNTASRQHLQ